LLRVREYSCGLRIRPALDALGRYLLRFGPDSRHAP
jgi:hypothetical protein